MLDFKVVYETLKYCCVYVVLCMYVGFFVMCEHFVFCVNG